MVLLCLFQLGKKMRSPFMKFLNHTCAYMVFLVLMFIASLRKGSGNPFLDMACHGFEKTLPDSAVFVLILIWVLGKFLLVTIYSYEMYQL